MTVAVRPATASDAADLERLIRALAAFDGVPERVRFTRAQLAAALSGAAPRLHALVAERGGVVLGFVSYTVDFAIWTGGEIVRVDDLFVTGTCRGQGIGRRLLAAVADLALARGAAACWEVEPANAAAQAFYRSLGVELRPKIAARWWPDAMAAFRNTPAATGRRTP